MQITSDQRRAFYRRMTTSVGVFVLLVSLALNVFLLLSRSGGSMLSMTTESANRPSLNDTLLLIPQAYGDVHHGFSLRPQTGAAVSAYVVPEGFIPAPPSATFLLYRDQGVPLDEDHTDWLMKQMGLTLPWSSLQLLPTADRWKTADRTMDISLDIAHRTLTVSQIGAFGPSPDGKADDAVSIELARAYALSLGVDTSSLGDPSIVEVPATSTVAAKTYVVWNAKLGEFPVIDLDGKPIPAVQVQIGRLSRRALSATFAVLTPERIARSAYPPAAEADMAASLKVGGLLPVVGGIKKSGAVATYASADYAYVLVPSDGEYPLYLVPVLRATWSQGKAAGVTYVPALDQKTFQWMADAPKQATSMSSSSSK